MQADGAQAGQVRESRRERKPQGRWRQQLGSGGSWGGVTAAGRGWGGGQRDPCAPQPLSHSCDVSPPSTGKSSGSKNSSMPFVCIQYILEGREEMRTRQ